MFSLFKGCIQTNSQNVETLMAAENTPIKGVAWGMPSTHALTIHKQPVIYPRHIVCNYIIDL